MAGDPPVEAAKRAVPESAPAERGCAHSARDARAQRRFRNLAALFSIVYLGAAVGMRWRYSLPVLSYGLVAAATLAAVFATWSYLRFLRGADELLRRIETEALALGFGVGLVLAILTPLFEKLGAPRLGGFWVAPAMMIAWSFGSWRGSRHFAGGRDGDGA
ncbi:MAG: hypothetical protein ABI639_04375 [Thermoanaerobaculia bacterium]